MAAIAGSWAAGSMRLGGPAELVGPLRVTADARLDDRVALAGSLGVTTEASDIELIGRAYLKWGAACGRHLIGDFAFAIWDEGRGELFCARDQLGVRPFHYRCDCDGIAFASRLNMIARVGDRFSTSRIAGYLAGIEDSEDETVFAEVQRLPPGHWLRWSNGQLRIERYWTLTTAEVSANEDFVAGFRERFLQAVDDRALGTTGLGAMLSGGLDSSSIVSAVARHGGEPLRTFSFAYPQSPRFDETGYVDAVLAKYPLTPEFVDMDNIGPLDGLADLADGADDLLFAPGLPKIARLLAAARKSGVRVMLDGHGGDEVVSQGLGRLGELARERRWRSLYRELRGVSAISGESAVRLLAQFYMSQGLAAKARRWLGRSDRATSPPSAAPLLDPTFVRATDLDERIEDWARDYRAASANEAALHRWNVSSPPVARAFETLRRVGDQMGIELRFPFYDRRLVSYALAVPDREKLKDGWPRSVLRRAMEGILPPQVQWRRSKIDFGPELAEGLVRHRADLLHEMLRDGAAVGEYVDLRSARACVARLMAVPSSLDGAALFMLWRVLFLALWLGNRNAALRPEKVLT